MAGEKKEYYTCGGAVTIQANYVTTANDFQWYALNGAPLGSGNTLNITPVGTQTYIIKYTNKCETSDTVTVHSVPLTVNSSHTAMEICENNPFNAQLQITVNAGETPTIQWYKNGAPYSSTTPTTINFAQARPSDSGQYSYQVTNRGCVVKDTIAGGTPLKVKPYIQVTPVAPLYIIERGKPVTMQLAITVPSAPTVPGTIQWRENNIPVNTGKDYALTSVNADHHYTIALSDPDYCDASAVIDLWVDASLQLEAYLDDVMCMGDTKVLTIDTTGTGAFRKTPAGVITVQDLTTGQTLSYTHNPITNRLEVAVSPTVDTDYKVIFTYDGQSREKSRNLQVLAPIQFAPQATVPRICQGEEITLSVSVTPAGTQLVWSDPHGTINGSKQGNTVYATPVAPNGYTNHTSHYTYTVTGTYAMCQPKTTQVTVQVDQPLSGQLEDTGICEGNTVTITAANYQADTYIWHSTNYQGQKSGATQRESPNQTGRYYVTMTRGACQASDDLEITVNSKPVIYSIDSIGVRSRYIRTFSNDVTLYAVDSHTPDYNPQKDNLNFGLHKFYIIDKYGCTSDIVTNLVEPLKLYPPIIFTPNDDGFNDTWEIKNIREIYPQAEITIYDRFGKQLIKYKGADTGWDGTYNGHDMPSTDYWYVIDVEEINKQYVGHFTLLRK